MLKVNNKSCEQRQVTFITAAQRTAHWWKCGTNGKCEWICEELIVQSWSFPDTPMANSNGGVWAKVAPYEWDDTHAKFSYDDMVAAYGTVDFSGVDALNIGATANANLTVQSCAITNCEDNMYIKMTDAERAEAYKTALIVVLASALAVIVIIIVVFLIILKRKSSYTYDVATGKYVKIEKNKK